MGIFEDCVEDFLRVVNAQATVFVVGAALTVTPQRTVEPPSRDCLADFSYYTSMATNRFYLAIALFGSISLAATARSQVKQGGGLQRMGFWMRFLVRFEMVFAVLFSAAATGLAIPTSLDFLQATTTLFSCLPVPDRSLIQTSYAVVSVVCVIMYSHFFRVAVFLV